VQTLSDMPTDDIVKYYSLYCVDTIQEAMNFCTESHTERLYNLLDSICFVRSNAVSTHSATDYGFRFTLDNRTWTMGDNIGYVASKIPQLGVFSLVADGIAGAMRQKETTVRVPQLLKAIQEQYPAFQHSVENAVSTVYHGILETCLSQVRSYYSEREKELREQNDQFLRVARQSAEKKAETQEAVKAVSRILNCLVEKT
ncbi:MAG: hypothetical protein IJT94_18840, partial [Oscillibacter sp.]|nr:hypothetical protein [Oscillibacter sp.]